MSAEMKSSLNESANLESELEQARLQMTSGNNWRHDADNIVVM